MNENINTFAKAYCLGWFISEGNLKNIPLYIKEKILNISESELKTIAENFDINFLSDELKNAFVLGLFDSENGLMPLDHKYPTCSISSKNLNLLENICKLYQGHKSTFDDMYIIEWTGNNCIDFLGKLYNNAEFKLNNKYNNYLDWCMWIPSLANHTDYSREPLFRWSKCREKSFAPYKKNVTDSGWDLTLLEKIKESGDTEFYSTGIKIAPAYGWYFDLVPRSSLSKSDYMLANSVGIIDRSYRGEVIVALRKMKENPIPLELPGRYVQIIPRPVVHGISEEVSELDLTNRGEGGFGSTN